MIIFSETLSSAPILFSGKSPEYKTQDFISNDILS